MKFWKSESDEEEAMDLSSDLTGRGGDEDPLKKASDSVTGQGAGQGRRAGPGPGAGANPGANQEMPQQKAGSDPDPFSDDIFEGQGERQGAPAGQQRQSQGEESGVEIRDTTGQEQTDYSQRENHPQQRGNYSQQRGSAQQQTPNSQSMDKRDTELIMARLDAIKSQLESLNQRVLKIERIAEQENTDQDNKRGYSW